MKKFLLYFVILSHLLFSCDHVTELAVSPSPDVGWALFLVPAGTDIGGHITEQEGVYMSATLFNGVVEQLRNCQPELEFIWRKL